MVDLMAALCPGSHVRLISLYHAGELREAIPLGGLADSMAHEIDGREPLVKRNLAILEDGPYRSGELTLAASALVEGPKP